MAIWYQSAQVPSPAPCLPEGGSTGPPEVAGVPPLLVEVDLLLWRGVDGFPPWLGAVDLLTGIIPLLQAIKLHRRKLNKLAFYGVLLVHSSSQLGGRN